LLSQARQLSDVNNTEAFKACVKNTAQWLDLEFGRADITSLVTGRAKVVDVLLQRAWQLHELDQVKKLCLVAVGGYGRGQLQPHSDIDFLILSRTAISKETQEKVSNFVTLLWDTGLDIGQSVRTIKQTMQLAREDITIATNLIESRLLAGCSYTFEDLQEKIKTPKRFWNSKDFFLRKYQEQIDRHKKFNGTAYNLEPNIKENPGCLRDIQNIGWIAKKHFHVFDGKELMQHGYFNQQEFDELLACREQLWKIRFALHLIAGRSENRLLFDYQAQVAERLGYGSEGKASVEKMMKNFFRQVRHISELNQMLVQRFRDNILELDQRATKILTDDFELFNDQVRPRHDNVFPNPLAIFQFLQLLTDETEIKALDTETLRQLRNVRTAFGAHYWSEEPQCRRLFMQLMQQPAFFDFPWDVAFQHGILQAYLREWDNIVGMMQFDLFHAYTVDEHTHRLVKHIRDYFRAEQQAFPRCHQIVKQLDKPEILFIAAIFHDIAKGRGGDHSVLGASDMKTFCEKHDIAPVDADLMSWLVEQHLLMSVVAQRRDIYDPEVVAEFAGKMKTHLHLNLLYALTLADIRATNDNLWNDWKSSLLRELYLLTQKVLENGLQCQDTLSERGEQHQQQALVLLEKSALCSEQIYRHWQRFDKDYFIRFKPTQIAWHTEVILTQDNRDNSDILVELSNNTSRSGTELILYAKDRLSLFAQVVSVLDSRNCSIHDARITSLNDGYIFDSFTLLEQDGSAIESTSRIKSIKKAIHEQLNKPGKDHANQRKMSRQMQQLKVPTKVRFFEDNGKTTLLELEALDKPGLLAEVSHVLVDLEMPLHMAKISTIGERAEDLFVISNSHGNALTTQQQVALQQNLTTKLDSLR
jgi:[protein-PII] uridylyltransferase